MSQGQWGADPSRRHQWRWWDGTRWTEYVRDGDQAGVDALGPVATTAISTPRAAAGSLVLEPSAAASVRKRWPVKAHVILSVVTCGLWLLALPAVLLWQRGSRRAGAIAGAAAATLVIAAAATNGGAKTVDAASTVTETRAAFAAVGSATPGTPSSTGSVRPTAGASRVAVAATTSAPAPAPTAVKPAISKAASAKPTTAKPTSAAPAVVKPTTIKPTTQAPPGSATMYNNCTEFRRVYPHGVGRPGAADHTSGKPVTTFLVNASVYAAAMAANSDLDRDQDGIACEQA